MGSSLEVSRPRDGESNGRERCKEEGGRKDELDLERDNERSWDDQDSETFHHRLRMFGIKLNG